MQKTLRCLLVSGLVVVGASSKSPVHAVAATAAPITEAIGELTGIASAIAAHMVVGGKVA